MTHIATAIPEYFLWLRQPGAWWLAGQVYSITHKTCRRFFMSFRITRLVSSYDSFTHILQDCFIDTTNIHYFISYTIWWAYNDDEKIIFIYWSSVSYWLCLRSGPWFNIKMSSYQYRKSHCGDKTILRPSYLHNRISYTGKMVSLYWIRALVLTSQSIAQCIVGPGNCYTDT